jgi:predicted CxxxxCH...CXXCH cytochrome family protein
VNPAITCEVCHTGEGPEAVAPHPDGIPVIGFPAIINGTNVTFNGNGLIATYSPITKTCSNVSCHGLRANALGNPLPSPFPAWDDTSAVFDQTNCLLCHPISVVAPPLPAATVPPVPYNGPFSGTSPNFPNLHNAHLQSITTGYTSSTCLFCHAAPGASHWVNIWKGNRLLPRGTAAVGGTAIGSYNPASSSCLTAGAGIGVSCHDSGVRLWY